MFLQITHNKTKRKVKKVKLKASKKKQAEINLDSISQYEILFQKNKRQCWNLKLPEIQPCNNSNYKLSYLK